MLTSANVIHNFNLSQPRHISHPEFPELPTSQGKLISLHQWVHHVQHVHVGWYFNHVRWTISPPLWAGQKSLFRSTRVKEEHFPSKLSIRSSPGGLQQQVVDIEPILTIKLIFFRLRNESIYINALQRHLLDRKTTMVWQIETNVSVFAWIASWTGLI